MRIKGYDDVKMSLVGVIDNWEFAELLKANFIKSLAFEICELKWRKHDLKLYKICKEDIS